MPSVWLAAAAVLALLAALFGSSGNAHAAGATLLSQG
jgi:hypothetical protein